MSKAESMDGEHQLAAPPRNVQISLNEFTTIHFQKRFEAFGMVRVQTWPEGLEIWVGGQRVWKTSG